MLGFRTRLTPLAINPASPHSGDGQHNKPPPLSYSGELILSGVIGSIIHHTTSDDLADRAGFEPAEHLLVLTPLAGARFKPLSHLSKRVRREQTEERRG